MCYSKLVMLVLVMNLGLIFFELQYAWCPVCNAPTLCFQETMPGIIFFYFLFILWILCVIA